MRTYKYKPYYEYNGPTRSDPFREQLTADEIERNMRWFFERLDGCFVGTDAFVEHDGTSTASITTSIIESDCDEIVKRHLNWLDLFAHKVREP